ncbi:hypothetical protein [Haloactinopolyspora sp.]|uniref:hypothetical protein n=1 Tax=Haloactinopolyspora sp. TaxID=1966353 RepID=UPI002631AF45|nr:hypothetical protein [Haloactinopolyspora sp.]
MNKFVLLIRLVHRAENKVASDMLAIGERHKTDHEIYHLTHDFARWSRRHVDLLAEAGQRHGAELDHADDDSSWLRPVREKASELFGRRPETGLVLLRDLRELHLDLVGLSVDWEILAQAAQGVKDSDLLDVAQTCHPETLRQARWTNAMIKVISPQVIAS